MNLRKTNIWQTISPYWKLHHRWLYWLKYFGFSEEDLKEIEQEDEKELALFKELENEWRKTQIHFSDKELFKIFPEAKEVIPYTIKEYTKKRKKLVEIVKKKLVLVKNGTKDNFSYWFWREWVKLNEGEELLKIDKNIARLKRFSSVAKGLVLKGWLIEEQIQRALTIPIESLINQPLKRSGKALVGLCPFHQEKRPSFFIYPETNSFYCYGCKKGGNVITFIRLFYGYSFSEAVRWLLNI